MIAICKKELRAYFTSVIGYVYLALFLFVCGFYFITVNILPQNGSIQYFFRSASSVFLLVIPLLTMKIFSDEKRTKTLSFLFSLPLSPRDIILGKFFATVIFFLIGLSVTLLYPGILLFYGSFHLKITVLNYIGVILLVSVFISMGLFVSLLTESQLVAAIITYTAILVLWLIDSVAPYVNSDVIKQIIISISFHRKFTEVSMGIFNPASFAYYILVTVYFLYISTIFLKRGSR